MEDRNSVNSIQDDIEYLQFMQGYDLNPVVSTLIKNWIIALQTRLIEIKIESELKED